MPTVRPMAAIVPTIWAASRRAATPTTTWPLRIALLPVDGRRGIRTGVLPPRSTHCRQCTYLQRPSRSAPSRRHIPPVRPFSASRSILQQQQQQQQQQRQPPRRLSEDIYTLPNMLTIGRICATPVLGYLIITSHPIPAAFLFFTAGLTDWIDGYLARKWDQRTVFGSIVDPLADKLLITTVVVSLAVQGALPPPLALLILGRDGSLAVAALYYRYASLPEPKTFRRYWDPSLPSAVVHPTAASKANTFLQLSYIMALMLDPLVRSWGGVDVAVLDMAITTMQAVVVGTTTWSWAEYVIKPDAVTVLGPATAEQKRRIGFRGRALIGAGLGVCAGVWAWTTLGRESKNVTDADDDKNVD